MYLNMSVARSTHCAHPKVPTKAWGPQGKDNVTAIIVNYRRNDRVKYCAMNVRDRCPYVASGQQGNTGGVNIIRPTVNNTAAPDYVVGEITESTASSQPLVKDRVPLDWLQLQGRGNMQEADEDRRRQTKADEGRLRQRRRKP